MKGNERFRFFVVFIVGVFGLTACGGKSESSGGTEVKATSGRGNPAQIDTSERDLKQEEIQKQIMEQQHHSQQMANQQRQMIMQQTQAQQAQQQAIQNSLQSQRQTQQAIDAANQARKAGNR
ncbi:MAG: hypothetical protein JNK54_04460 [Elusimicrobia bacterium]|jgi:hypothetical protein|nr:hypothetical protein [Elusimicrobiota bacterium]